MKKIISMLLVLSLLLGFGISPVFAVEIGDTIISDDLIVDIAAAEKCQALADEVNEKRSLELEIDRIKPLSDFAGNAYYAIEFLPEGYAIMHGETGQRVEFSPYGQSPYSEVSGELYYCGPTYYYYEQDGAYHHVWYDEVLEGEIVASAAEVSGELDNVILQSISEPEYDINDTSVAVGEDLDPDCILFLLDDEYDMGCYSPENSNGVCGYIAAGLALLWHRHYDNKSALIDGFTYLYDDNSKFIDPDFTRKLRSFGSQDASSADGYIFWGESIKDVIESYGDSINVDIACYTTVSPIPSGIIYSLQNNRKPIILFGLLAPEQSAYKQQHAVLAYGYTNDNGIIVHYGHPGLSYVELYYSIIASSLSITNITVNPMTFSDVSSSDWAYPGAAYCSRYGIISNYSGNTFGRSRPMTRGMFVNAIYKLYGEPEINESLIEWTSEQFTDFNESYIYSDALVWAYANGIIVGTSDTQLSPNATVTREQAVTFLYRYNDMMYYDYDVDYSKSVEDFNDWEDMEDYAYWPMDWAVTCGIINGTPEGMLEPKLTMPKEDCATMLLNFSNVAVYY